MFSIVILTLNEEKNLAGCLASISWCDDIVILDSHSTDRTLEIAKGENIRVLQRHFDDFAEQRNHALDKANFRYRWVFHLDADERFTLPLRQECREAIRADQHSCFLVPSKMMFMDRWLRFSGMYPSYQMRLLKRGEVRFVQKGHGQREGKSSRGIGRLKEPYLHYCFNNGIEEWLRKHNQYSSLEAEESLNDLADKKHSLCQLVIDAARSRDPVWRRRALKKLSSRLPCRPVLRFVYMYILRCGFLDGLPGYHYSRLLALYEYMILLKIKEARRRHNGLPL